MPEIKKTLSKEEEVKHAIECYKSRYMVPPARKKRLEQQLRERAPFASASFLTVAALQAADQASQAATAAILQQINGVLTFNLDTFMQGCLAEQTALATMDSCFLAAKVSTILHVGLLGYHFALNIRKYWQGEIDLEECVKESISKAAFGAGLLGAAAVFSAVHPALGVIGGITAGLISEQAWRQMFDVCVGDDKYRRLQKARSRTHIIVWQ